jgi:putative addiction module CopG family antidote
VVARPILTADGGGGRSSDLASKPRRDRMEPTKWRKLLMTIHLSEELERFIQDAVRSGRYASEDEVVRDALDRLRKQSPPTSPGEGLIGAMRDDAELLEQVTQDVMESRRARALRVSPDE